MIINKKELLTALETVKPGLANKEVIEQSTSFAFIEDKVVTYNDEISISCPINNLNLTGAIKADELYKLLSKLKDDEIDLSVTDNEVQMKCGKVKAGFTLVSEVKLPLDEVQEKGKWKNIPENFIEAFKFVASECSNDNSWPLLTCVHISDKGYVEGSDGWKLARFFVDNPFVNESILIPASNISQAIKINPIKIAKSNGWVHFKNEENVIFSSRIFADDKYKEIKIDLKKKGKILSFSKFTIDAIEAASIFKTELNNVDIHIENNILTIKSQSETGWFEESVRIKYNDEPLNFSITPIVLKSILSKTLNGEVCENILKFKGDNWLFIALKK